MHSHDTDERGWPKTKEITPASGALCGGTFVDKAFLKFIRTKWPSPQEFDKWAQENPERYEKMFSSWESKKQVL